MPSTSHPKPPASSVAAKQAASRVAAREDADLVRRFVTLGDEAAFIAIVERHRAKISGVVSDFLHNHADTEEVVQDTFIRAHRGLKNFRGDSSLATWLHRVAVNLARNRYWHFQRRGRKNTLSLDYTVGEAGTTTVADFIASEAAGPAQETIQTEFAELVTLCMGELPAGQREILEMRNVMNRSYHDIAQSLDIEVGTVKSRIARARGQLKTLMAQKCPEFTEAAVPADWFESNRAGACHAGAHSE